MYFVSETAQVRAEKWASVSPLFEAAFPCAVDAAQFCMWAGAYTRPLFGAIQRFLWVTVGA